MPARGNCAGVEGAQPGRNGAFGRSLPEPRYSRQLIDETIAVWQPFYDAKLTDDDARQIIHNMTTFIRALLDARGDLRSRGETSSKSD